MTNKHDGPRSAAPTRLTQAEAEELFRLTEAATTAAFNWANEMATHGSRSPQSEAAAKANSDAYVALYRWQREHGLTEEAWRRLK